MISEDSGGKHTLSPKSFTLIRKLRKKLRQIENLERLERELTEEEEIKVESKEEVRKELQELLSQQEDKEMVILTNQIGKASINSQSLPREEKGHFMNGNVVNEVVKDEALSEGNCEIDQNGLNDLPSIKNGDNCHANGLTLDRELDENDLAEGDAKIKIEIADAASTKENCKDEASKGSVKEEEAAIELTITKKSLRQRNHVSRSEPPVEVKKVAAHTSSTKSLFSDLIMEIKILEGHYQDVCSVDLHGDYVVSVGRDTAVKLWSASSGEELKSVGGHTGTVTAVKFMKDKNFSLYPSAVSGSYDCSIRIWDFENGTPLKCIYVYSPVICLDYLDGKIAIGTEGGKIEVYNDTGEQLLSVGAHGDAISSVKLLSCDKVASGSTDGVLKIFNISIAQLDPLFALDPSKITIKSAEIECEIDTKPHTLSMTHISCITSWGDLIIYGNEGFNMKVLDYKKGEITKVRNNLQEFCPTESIYVESLRGNDYLFSVGSDVDLGDAYINIRSLPDLKYLGTIRDSHSSTGPITSFCVQEVDSRIRFVSGGQQLRVWQQTSRHAKKRKNSSEEDCLIPCKFIRNYTEPRESEPDSDSDESEVTKTSSEESASFNHSSESSASWCAIL